MFQLNITTPLHEGVIKIILVIVLVLTAGFFLVRELPLAIQRGLISSKEIFDPDQPDTPLMISPNEELTIQQTQAAKSIVRLSPQEQATVASASTERAWLHRFGSFSTGRFPEIIESVQGWVARAMIDWWPFSEVRYQHRSVVSYYIAIVIPVLILLSAPTVYSAVSASWPNTTPAWLGSVHKQLIAPIALAVMFVLYVCEATGLHLAVTKQGVRCSNCGHQLPWETDHEQCPECGEAGSRAHHLNRYAASRWVQPLSKKVLRDLVRLERQAGSITE